MLSNDFFNNTFDEKVKEDGWSKIDAGSTRCIDYNNRCAVYEKQQKIAEVFNFSAKKSRKNAGKHGGKGTPTELAMVSVEGGGSVSTTSSFVWDSLSEFDFINKMRPKVDNIIFRADVCWFVNGVGNTALLSYNLSFVDFNDTLHTVVIFPFDSNKLPLDYLLSLALDLCCSSRRADSRKCVKYKYIGEINSKGRPVISCTSNKSEATAKGRYAFIDDKPSTTIYNKATSDKDIKKILTVIDSEVLKPVNITLLLNSSLRFLSFIKTDGAYDTNILSDKYKFQLPDMNHCIFTTSPLPLIVNSIHDSGWNYRYNVALSVRDVKLHNILDDHAKYDDFGSSIGFPLTDFSSSVYKKSFYIVLDKVLNDNPLLYFKFCYERNNAILFYIFKLWGLNKEIPSTLMSGACKAAGVVLKESLNCTSDAEYYSKYSGTFTVNKKERNKISKMYLRESKRMPLDKNCDEVQRYASFSYYGGYNGCFSVDLHNGKTTYDIDLASAYPTAMCLVPAVDWSHPIKYNITNRKLTFDDLKIDDEPSPMCPLFCHVTYSFPDDCKYPCLTRYRENDEEAPCFLLNEPTGVYCSGPELYMALKLGAEVFVTDGFVANVLRDKDGNIIYPYRDLVKSLVSDRAVASELYGKKSFEVKTLKLIVNSLYGKIAQNVSDMYRSSTKQSNESVITNNVSASLITSFVRAVLVSAFCTIDENGYKVYSATTDGLITDMPLDKFLGSDLMGLNKYLLESRRFITGDENPEIWSLKHEQTDLLNLCTRGNASMIVENKKEGILGGVIAKNGVSSKYPHLSKEDIDNRKAFYFSAVSRTDRVKSKENNYSDRKAIAGGLSYTAVPVEKNISLDYDMKRKPIRKSLQASYVIIDANTYEVAHIETVPFKDNDEYIIYRTIKKCFKCLRTVAEWDSFFNAIDAIMSGVSIAKYDEESLNWKILKDCIAGYKAGKWDIPYLNNPKLTVAQKVDWIEAHNPCSDHHYSKKFWDKASEKKNQEKLLPFELIKPILELLIR